MADKVYTKGIYFKVIPTKNGEIKKLSFHREKFINWMNEQEVTEKGYFSINITQLSQPDQYGNEYVLLLDNWKPDPNYKKSSQSSETPPAVRSGQYEKPTEESEDELNSLPF